MRRTRSLLAALTAAALAISLGAPGSAATDDEPTTGQTAAWRWPVSPPEVARVFAAPPHPYGAGHRGIDLVVGETGEVRAPAAGVVAFAGRVVDRELVTLDHGAGLVTTLEPVAPTVAPGQVVAAGDVVGVVAAGGHAAAGTVHFGVRADGVYINPLLLLGEVPRAVLLPCC